MITIANGGTTINRGNKNFANILKKNNKCKEDDVMLKEPA